MPSFLNKQFSFYGLPDWPDHERQHPDGKDQSIDGRDGYYPPRSPLPYSRRPPQRPGHGGYDQYNVAPMDYLEPHHHKVSDTCR